MLKAMHLIYCHTYSLIDTEIFYLHFICWYRLAQIPPLCTVSEVEEVMEAIQTSNHTTLPQKPQTDTQHMTVEAHIEALVLLQDLG